MKKLCSALVLICLVVLATPLFASPNTWEIVRADYGSGNNWRDVTDRVRSLVQGDTLNFRVDGDVLGAGSRRGRNRTLRLQVKDSNGTVRQMTYRDAQQVSLQVRPVYQSSLRIDRAIYGAGNRMLDVTARLNSQIERDELNVQVDSHNMGGDPAPREAKTLTVDYTLNGRRLQRTVREGDSLHLPYGTTTQGNLQINRAIYGSGRRTADVTSRLNSQVMGDQINIQVNNESMGGDPAPGQAKNLTLQYSMNGRTDSIVLNEGDVLRLPYGNSSQSNLQISRAIYGAGYRTSDVTSRLNSRVQGDQLNVLVNSDTMGGDPAPGQVKTLTVQYTVDGRNSQQVVTNEGDTLRLPSVNSDGLSQRIRCESDQSHNYGRQYCPTHTGGGVRITRVIGNSECNQGSTWGYDNGGIWVDKGCRAEFEMGNGRTASSLNATTIANGTELSVRTNEAIDSNNASTGQTFSAVIAADVLDNLGVVRIPRGSDAVLVIRDSRGGSITSASELVLDVDSLTVSGTKYTVSTDDLEQQGGQGVGANKRTAVMVGGGAAIGTLIGAIVGGGKGAAIGAAVGAGAGVGTEVLTKGHQVRVPAETVLSFRLDQDLRLHATR